MTFTERIDELVAAIAEAVNSVKIAEYVDADPPAPNVGAQWVRLSTVAPARCPTHLAPLGLIGNRLTTQRKAELKTQTSIGVIST